MNRTAIEYLDYTWNVTTGCTKGCSYCWARKFAKRLAGRYGYPKENPFQPIFHADRIREPYDVKKAAIIGVSFMGEFFDPIIDPMHRKAIFLVMRGNPHHIFIILTKRPENIPKESLPDNVWIGMSVDGIDNFGQGLHHLLESDAIVKFISFEPLLGSSYPPLTDIDWIIIGAQTQPTIRNQRMAKSLLDYARSLDIPVFMKDNMHWYPFPGPREYPIPRRKTQPREGTQ